MRTGYEKPKLMVSTIKNAPAARMRVSNTRMVDVTRHSRGKPGPGQYSPRTDDIVSQSRKSGGGGMRMMKDYAQNMKRLVEGT